MSHARSRSRSAAIVSAAALLFFVLGLIFIPLAGIEDDEALFALPLFSPPYLPFTLPIFHHHPPLMVFPYSGALKTYIYWPVFKLFACGVYSLRLPVVAMGALTIALFYGFARRIAGTTAALIAIALLATDPTFLLTNTFDFGPVALQHLLLAAGCFLVARGNLRSGCFALGLGMWDKAVLIWPLAGLAAGAAVAYWPEVRRTLQDRRRVAGAAIAFFIGSSPLILYNLRSHSETVRATAHFSLQNLSSKTIQLDRALNGSGFFRFLAAEPWEVEHPKPAASPGARVSAAIQSFAGERRTSLFGYAVLLSFLAAPLWWRTALRQACLFSAVFLIVAFAFMAITKDAGVAMHHTVLLWPMPHLLVGAALASIALQWPSLKWLPAAAAAVLAISNLLVINQVIYQLERFGADGNFTDALFPLSAQLSDSAGDHVYAADWGVSQSLTMLHRGKLELFSIGETLRGTDPVPPSWLEDPRGLFIVHTPDREAIKGAAAHLNQAAHAAGLQEQIVSTIADSTGRPVFQLLRLRRSP